MNANQALDAMPLGTTLVLDKRHDAEGTFFSAAFYWGGKWMGEAKAESSHKAIGAIFHPAAIAVSQAIIDARK